MLSLWYKNLTPKGEHFYIRGKYVYYETSAAICENVGILTCKLQYDII